MLVIGEKAVWKTIPTSTETIDVSDTALMFLWALWTCQISFFNFGDENFWRIPEWRCLIFDCPKSKEIDAINLEFMFSKYQYQPQITCSWKETLDIPALETFGWSFISFFGRNYISWGPERAFAKDEKNTKCDFRFFCWMSSWSTIAWGDCNMA